MGMFNQEITFDRFVRGGLVALFFGGALYLLDYLSSVLLPFFIAWLLAYMVYPLVSFMQYKMHLRSRGVCIVLTLLLVIAVVTGVVMLVVPSATEEYEKLKALLSQYVISGSHNATVPQAVQRYLREYITEENISRFFHEGSLTEVLKQAVPKVWGLIYETMNFLLGLFTVVLVLMYMFFILLDYESLSNGWIHLIPKHYRPFVGGLMADVKNGMNAYFRGQALVALCVGILFSLGFIIIDFPMAIALGMFIGLLNMVPYLQVVGLVPTLLLALLKASDTGDNFWIILLSALAIFAVVQTLQDMVLVPKIMGHITGLNPAVILLSLSVWGALLGMIGLIIALPLTTLIISYYHRYVLHDEMEQLEDSSSMKDDSLKDDSQA